MDYRLKYSQKQITDALYGYFVEGQRAAYICESILDMSRKEIGNTNAAWRNISPIYKSFGFEKRYDDGSCYRKITYKKLEEYVAKYWYVPADEDDLVDFFPEIAEVLYIAKKNDEKASNSWSSGIKKQSGEVDERAFEKKSSVSEKRITNSLRGVTSGVSNSVSSTQKANNVSINVNSAPRKLNRTSLVAIGACAVLILILAILSLLGVLPSDYVTDDVSAVESTSSINVGSSINGDTIIRAEELERRLNNKEKMVGAVVLVDVLKVVPNSVLGFNIHSGEHLNFTFSNAFDVKAGDKIVVSVRDVSNVLGSWEVSSEFLRFETLE